MPTARPKVIYVLGWGHSGSTLLDMIIGTAPEAVSVGEIIFFDYYHREIPHPKVYWGSVCTCTKRFGECEFWHAVVSDGPIDPPPVYDETGLQRLAWVWRYIGYRLRGRKRDNAGPPIGDDGQLFRAVLKAAGPGVSFVCDSSKDFARFARLLMNPEVDVFPIFLVRDARAVANSYTKKVREELALNRLGYVKSILMWIVINSVSRLLLAFESKPYLHVSYDRFAKDPSATIRRLNEWLGISIEEEEFVAKINAQTYHNIGGNWGRMKKVEKVKYDDRWRQQSPPLGKRIGAIVCAPFHWRWVNRDTEVVGGSDRTLEAGRL